MSKVVGSLLVARPVLKDQFFTQAVVLMMQHGPDGAFGLVLNRPAKNPDLPFPVYIGGPCKFEGFLLLHGHQDWLPDVEKPAGQIMPGVFMGDSTCMEKVTAPENDEPLRFRMFAGYSGWGPNQLEKELGEGVWAMVQGRSEHVFEVPPEELWDKVVPPSIPQPSVN